MVGAGRCRRRRSGPSKNLAPTPRTSETPETPAPRTRARDGPVRPDAPETSRGHPRLRYTGGSVLDGGAGRRQRQCPCPIRGGMPPAILKTPFYRSSAPGRSGKYEIVATIDPSLVRLFTRSRFGKSELRSTIWECPFISTGSMRSYPCRKTYGSRSDMVPLIMETFRRAKR